MPNEITREQIPLEDELEPSQSQSDKKVDHVAEDAAVKASKTQKRFDQSHDIFTK